MEGRGRGTPAALPLAPDPLHLLVCDQQLAAPPPPRRLPDLPAALRQLDRADAELGGGVRQAGRRRRHVADQQGSASAWRGLAGRGGRADWPACPGYAARSKATTCQILPDSV